MSAPGREADIKHLQFKGLFSRPSQRTAFVYTLAGSGISLSDLGTWWGIAGPAGLPADIVNALNAEIGKMLASPDSAPFSRMRGAEAQP
jgi:tripartite-type tricarboxylate transporter receptor subunit TctC